jgi:hypothetical protein
VQEPSCEICGDPTDANVCRRDIADLARRLRTHVVDVAAEVETTIARQARYGERGGTQRPADDDGDAVSDFVNRAMPVGVFGWPASKERPKRNALIETRLPYQPGAEKRAHAAEGTIVTWARHVAEERGIGTPMPGPVQGPLCRAGWGCNHRTCDLIRARSIDHPAARAATFLLDHLDWIRHRPEAAEAVDELNAAAATLQRVVDSPPALAYAGPCWNELGDGERCEFELYAVEGRNSVTCQGCGEDHDLAARRRWLLGEAQDALATAATLAAALSSLDTPVTSSMIRNYADRGRIVAHGHDRQGRPLYRVGDVVDVLADVAKRKGGVAA